jgi:N-acetylglucosamine-6-phosphate deacetylase
LDIGEDLVARSPDGSHLVGSTVTMERSVENLVRALGLSGEAAQKLVSENPRRSMREPDGATNPV